MFWKREINWIDFVKQCTFFVIDSISFDIRYLTLKSNFFVHFTVKWTTYWVLYIISYDSTMEDNYTLYWLLNEKWCKNVIHIILNGEQNVVQGV